MPKILPAILCGAVVGFVIGPIACVFAARVSTADDAAPRPGTSVAAASHRPGASGWLAELIDLAASFGPPARSEYFLLAPVAGTDDSESAATPSEGAREIPDSDDDDAVAVLAMRRLERPGFVLLEREIVFREGGVRLHHTERIEGGARRLVWREFVPHGTRTWMAEWQSDGAEVRTIAYGWKRPVHEELAGSRGMMGPLELVDRLRTEPFAVASELALVDPTAARVEAVAVRTVDLVAGAAREASVRRSDGSLVLDAVLEIATPADEAQAAIVSVRFQDGSTVATPIDAGEYARRSGRWRHDTLPGHESVLAVIPDRR